jgi:AcrR family transcriptional regulator
VISQSNSDKRSELLTSALQLFVKQGFHGTPTSKIAKEAGVANGTLFHYFASKEDLILALYIDIKTRMSEYLNLHADKNVNVSESLRSYYKNSLEWALKNQVEFRFLLQFQSSPYQSKVNHEQLHQQSGALNDVLKAAIEQQVISDAPFELIYSLLGSHVYGMMQYLISRNFDLLEQKKIIDDSFRRILNMLK